MNLSFKIKWSKIILIEIQNIKLNQDFISQVMSVYRKKVFPLRVSLLIKKVTIKFSRTNIKKTIFKRIMQIKSIIKNRAQSINSQTKNCQLATEKEK